MVLDPFVFGVIYIEIPIDMKIDKCFRPLRFWGYLYPIRILNGIFVDIENPLFIFYHKFTKNQYSKIRFCFFNIFSPKANSPDKIFILLNWSSVKVKVLTDDFEGTSIDNCFFNNI